MSVMTYSSNNDHGYETETPKGSKEYKVTWTIEVDAESAEDAARYALQCMLDPHSSAMVFEVVESNDIDEDSKVQIDLADID